MGVIIETIKKCIENACIREHLPCAEIHIEHPDNLDFGDFSTNLPLVVAKRVDMAPRDVAKKIVLAVQELLPKEIAKVEVAGPGFINFYLSKEFFASELKTILEKGETYGMSTEAPSKTLTLEYTNTNVLKPFHIGHLMGNIIGESLSRIFEWNNIKVTRITYGGDVGLHIGKAVWGMLHMKDAFPHDDDDLSSKVSFVGNAYAYGAEQYEKGEEAALEIKEVNKSIFEKTWNEDVRVCYEKARLWSVAHFEEIYEKLGSKFDACLFESEVGERGLAIVKEFLKKGVFEESDGAIVYRGDKHGLHTRVFVNSQGLPTYEAKDIAHAFRKQDTFNTDEYVVVTANEQDDYFRVVLRALYDIDHKLAEKTHHLSHGMLRMPEGKMSSRKGNVITGESLISDTEAEVWNIVKNRELPESVKKNIAEYVAIAAIKYAILRQAPGGDIIFDRTKALSFEGDSGPYLQYTAVRAGSVLEKADWKNKKPTFETTNPEIYPIEKYLYRFGEVVTRAGNERSPHYLVTYLLELCASFNNFYAHNKIIDAGEETDYRLGITQATQTVITNGLWLLGIRVPEKM